MAIERAQIVDVVLLIGGLLFVFDVVSPFTPNPQAQTTGALGILFCLALAAYRVKLFCLPPHSVQLRPERSPVAHRRKLTAWICVLLC